MQSDNAFAIDVCGLQKYFGSKHVVKNLSLQVKKGEIVGFLGPNGSGKTTAMRMICGLLTPDGGTGSCLGYDILTQSDMIKREVGYMTQKFSYWEELSIRENLDFIARVYEIANRKHIVGEALENLGLSTRANQLAKSLSGGWKQRVALAACMLRKPKLLLLDEPTAGVDPGARRDFWDELHYLSSLGVSALVSTHYMDEAERCHKLAYIAYGELLATGSAKSVVREQNLSTFAVSGERLTALAEKLKSQKSVEQTVMFGQRLHVSGKDGDAIMDALNKTIDSSFGFERVETSLEDVFIYIMRNSADNFGAES